jgi:hypothetical protein
LGLLGVLVLLIVCDLFDYGLPLALLPPDTVIGRKQTTRDELNARAKANDYKRGHTGKKTGVETAISTRTTS